MGYRGCLNWGTERVHFCHLLLRSIRGKDCTTRNSNCAYATVSAQFQILMRVPQDRIFTRVVLKLIPIGSSEKWSYDRQQQIIVEMFPVVR